MALPHSSSDTSDICLSPSSLDDDSCSSDESSDDLFDSPLPREGSQPSTGSQAGVQATRRRAGKGSSRTEHGGKKHNRPQTQQKEKEPHLVQRRNARERRRVQLVNDGFVRLRRKIPTEPRNKKLSKVKTLRSAINYIMHLQETLNEAANRQTRIEEMENVGMNVAMAHQAQPIYSDWPQYDLQNMCNGYNDYPVENHPGYYY